MRHRQHVALPAFIALALLLGACGQNPASGKAKSRAKILTVSAVKASPTSSPKVVGAIGETPIPGLDAPTPSPSAGETTPAPIAFTKVTMGGTIYDAAGATVDGVQINVHSLDPARAFDATVTGSDGAYVVNGVPEGTNIVITATKAGWTSRRIVTAFQSESASANIVDFGGAGGRAAYFLSDYPEIAAMAIVTSEADSHQVSARLTLSEPLDESNRRRFEDALCIFPANNAASPDGVDTNQDDLSDVTAGSPIVVGTAYQYAIRRDTMFGLDTGSRVKVSWNEAGTEATLRFAAPLLTSRSSEACYQVGLVRAAGANNVIADGGNHQLGTNEAGSQFAYPTADGALIWHAFRETRLSLDDAQATAESRWALTHSSVAGFAMPTDTQAPTLLGVDVATIANDTRITLTFDEPLAAYDGSATGKQSDRLGNDPTDLSRYTFAVGENERELADVALEGRSVVVVDPLAAATYPMVAGAAPREFSFAEAAFDVDGDRLTPGEVAIEVDPVDPRRIRLTLVGRPNYFGPTLRALSARVVDVADPAGNLMTPTIADKQVVTGAI